MEARENLSSDLVTVIDAEIAADTYSVLIEPDQTYIGLAYDRENRTIVYSVSYINPEAGLHTNSTGFRLWSGVNAIASGATYDPYNYRNYSLMTRGLDDDVVTRWDSYDSTSLVPNGIGGSDGTARRFIESAGGEPQTPKLCDPRTRDVACHMVSNGAPTCRIEFLRFSDSYKKTLSPYIPDGNRHLELAGCTANWWIVGDLGKIGSSYAWQFIPRVRRADEVTADKKLSYGEIDTPAGLADCDAFRWAFDSDGTMWFVGWTAAVGGVQYTLWRMPTPAVIANPATVGAFTEETPWGASDGMNTGTSIYDNTVPGRRNAVILYHMPADSRLVALNKLYSGGMDPTGGYGDFKLNATEIQLPGLAYSTTSGFVTGYMDAAWQPSATLPTTGYAVLDVWEADQADLAYHDHTFTNANYTDRWLAFSVLPIVAGVVGTQDPAATSTDPIKGGTKVVFARYSFAGAAPELLTFIDEAGWDAAYTTYATAISNTNVVRASFSTYVELNSEYYDFGIYDAESNAFWFGGKSDPNMWSLDADFTDRGTGTGGPFSENPPFLRLSFGEAAFTSQVMSHAWIGRP